MNSMMMNSSGFGGAGGGAGGGMNMTGFQNQSIYQQQQQPLPEQDSHYSNQQ